jgi:hypothetical protein
MSLLVGIAIIVVADALAIGALLFVRRRAPEGSYFADGDRASGVFGVLATGFSVLLGFIVFLAFASYDQSRTGAETEALVLLQQVENAQLFPPAAGRELTGQLICYGRSVVNDEWDRMKSGAEGDAPNAWAVPLFDTLRTVTPVTASQQSAYDKWLEQTSDREEARRDRVHGAAGIIPSPLWVVLFFISAVVFAYMLFFADSGESAVTQGMLMGAVASVITTLLLLLAFLDNPFHTGVGGLEPTAMERTLRALDGLLPEVAADVTPPCDAEGRAT